MAERWIGALRRELLDHVVILNQHYLIQLVHSYIRYYHEDRCHLGLARDTPDGRPVTSRPSPHVKVVALPRVGGCTTATCGATRRDATATLRDRALHDSERRPQTFIDWLVPVRG